MFGWILQNTLVVAVLTAIVALSCRTFRLSPAARHALWLVVLLKLLTPPLWQQSLPGWLLADGLHGDPSSAERLARQETRLLERDSQSSAGASIGLPDADGDRWARDSDSVAGAVGALSGSRDGPTLESKFSGGMSPWESRGADSDRASARPAPTSATRLAFREPWAAAETALPWCWLVGTIVVSIVHGARLVRFYRLRRRASAAPAALDRLVTETAALLRIRAPLVLTSSEVRTPLVCFLGRAVLVWPAAGLRELGGDGLRAVLIHELAHVRRRDHWAGWLELAACCGWWWNPLFWYVRRQLRENAELACDAWVVSMLPAGRKAYARTLVDLCQTLSLSPAPSPAVGIGHSSRRNFERRLNMILRERVNCKAPVIGIAILGLALLVALPGWSTAQVAPPGVTETVPTNSNGGLLGPVQVPAPTAEAPPAKADPNLTPPAAAPGATKARDDAGPPKQRFIKRILVLGDGTTQAELTGEPPAATNGGSGEGGESNGVEFTRTKPVRVGPGGLTGAGVGAMMGHALGNRLKSARTASVADPSPDDVERLSNLEQRIAQLQAELQQWRASHGVTDPSQPEMAPMGVAVKLPPHAQYPAATANNPLAAGGFAINLPPPLGARDVQMLTRAKYALPSGTAEALAAFIKEHVKGDVEAKVDGQTLIVTAPQNEQDRIGAFVELLNAPSASAPRESVPAQR